LRAVCETTGWDVGGLWVVDRRANVLSCVSLWPAESETGAEFHVLSRRITFAQGVGLPGRVWASGQSVWVVDITTDPNSPRAAAAAKAGLCGGFCFPIHFGNEVLGVAEFFGRVSRPPDEELLRTFGSLGSQIGQFIERQRTQRALRAAEQRLQHVVTSSPSVLFTLAVVDESVRGISWISGNLKELLGYSPEEAYAPDWWLGNIHPEDRDRVAQAHAELFDSGRAAHEYRFRHRDGNYRWTRGEIRLIRGESVEVVGSWSDVTERRQLEEQFRQSQKMEAVGRLAGGVAHDFNNLLTIINGYGELMLGNLPNADPNRELVREVVAAGERASGLTRQLLAFSRKAIIEPRVLDLRAVVTDVERMLRRIVGEDVQLSVAADPEVGAVRADPGQVEQVILNLVVNARDAMPRGGRIIIEVRNVELDETYSRTRPDARPGPHVLLAVTDTGCGMDEATVARVFEPFFTTKGERGTGLGLATVHGIVRQGGGHVSVDSEVGHGTAFKVYLPRAENPRPAAGARPGGAAAPRGSETVLLVEDEEGVRKLTRYVLLACGYTVVGARDGAEALRLAEQHTGRIALLLTDVVMPGMSGREVAERLGKMHPGIKVLFVSGYTDDEVVRHGILEAQVAFLQKPFSPTSLAVKVREVLDAR
jgi:two-component system, cell cycle sensor histidine kinase and response regulator CckA